MMNTGWKLIDVITGLEICYGDEVAYLRDGEARTIRVLSGTPPHNPPSSGRVYVRYIDGPQAGEARELFPHVFDLKFEREAQDGSHDD